MPVQNLPDVQLPPHSLSAWERFAASLECSPVPYPAEFADLRLLGLPQADRVLSIDPEIWVTAYESELARVHKEARKMGEAQTGVFYTPPAVAHYLVSRTLGTRLSDARQQIEAKIRQKNLQAALEILAGIQALRIVDPACGTGVFLVEALKALHEFYHWCSQQCPALSFPVPAFYAFTYQLYGVDLDPLAVWVTEARLSQWVQQLDQLSEIHLHPAARNLMAGDALIGNVGNEADACLPEARLAARRKQIEGTQEDAPESIWSGWQSTFPEVRQWDFILGNPPYVSEVRRQSGRFESLRQQEGGYYQAKMDLCDAFLSWAMDHLKAGGELAYVLPEYWTHRTNTAHLRKRIWREGMTRELWNFPGRAFFANAPGHHSALFIWQKETPESKDIHRPLSLGSGDTVACLSASRLQEGHMFLDPVSGKLLYGQAVEIQLLSRLSSLPRLFRADQIQQGILLPQGRLDAEDLKKLPDGEQITEHEAGLFLLTEAEVASMNLNAAERNLLKPFFLHNGFSPFMGFPNAGPDYFLIYANDKNRKLIETEPETYPHLKAHLDRMAVLNTSDFAPYGLHRARQTVWFEGDVRILSPRQTPRPAFGVVDFPAYVSEAFYVIRPAEGTNPHLLVALLNSRLSWFWLHKQKRKGQRLQVDKDVLTAFPAPPQPAEKNLHLWLVELAEALSEPDPATHRESLRQALDEAVCTWYGLSQEEQKMLADWYP